jgi:hypothetical protein
LLAPLPKRHYSGDRPITVSWLKGGSAVETGLDDKLISIQSAVTLTGRSERTLWRWIADGTLIRATEDAPNGKTMVYLASIRPHISIPMESEDFDLIVRADKGNAEAQNDLGLLFLSNGQPEKALYWLNLAAEQNYADAMHWLGRCYIDGTGVARDDNLGTMWLSKAAAYGHMISQAQMQTMRESLVGKR